MRAEAFVVHGTSLIWRITFMAVLTTSQIFPTPTCSPSCLNGGTCNRTTLTCTCVTGWTGSDCSQQFIICDPGCQNGGTCTRPNVCTCDSDEWGGKTCTIAICDKGFCKNGGTCLYPNINCTSCNNGWGGDRCEKHKSVSVEVLVPSLVLGILVVAMLVLLIAIIVGKCKKRPSVESIDTQDNAAYRAIRDRKWTSQIPFRPMTDTDVIYDDPLPHKLKEDIYENTDIYQYI